MELNLKGETMDVQEFLSQTENLSQAGRCEVCWTELVGNVPPSTETPHYLHAAFYSVDCRVWWLCTGCESRIVEELLTPNDYCKHGPS